MRNCTRGVVYDQEGFLVVISALIIFLSLLKHYFALYSWVDEQGVVCMTYYPKPGPAPMEKEQEGAAQAGAPIEVIPLSEQIKDAAPHATAVSMKLTEAAQQKKRTCRSCALQELFEHRGERFHAVRHPVSRSNVRFIRWGLGPTSHPGFSSSGEAPASGGTVFPRLHSASA